MTGSARSAANIPWWVWLLGGIFVVNLVTRGNFSLFPLVIVGMVLWNLQHRRSNRSCGPLGEHHTGHQQSKMPPAQQPAGELEPLQDDAPPVPDPYRTGGQQGQGQPASGSSMPTIDVPRYPGGGNGIPASAPSHAAANQPPPLIPTPTSSSSTDPMVSLAQLQLSRCGRDLQHARSRGTTAEVDRTLGEIEELTRRYGDSLAGGGMPGDGREEFLRRLRSVSKQLSRARSERPPGAAVDRLAHDCLSVGQNG